MLRICTCALTLHSTPESHDLPSERQKKRKGVTTAPISHYLPLLFLLLHLIITYYFYCALYSQRFVDT